MNKKVHIIAIIIAAVALAVTFAIYKIQSTNEEKQNPEPAATLKSEIFNNIYDLKTVKKGEKYGLMTVSDVIPVNDTELDVTFTGEVTISGTFTSILEQMYGTQIIYLYLDNESASKVPKSKYMKKDLLIIEYDPDKDKDKIESFGEDTKGSFKITLSGIWDTETPESYSPRALISKIIETKIDK